MSQVDLRQKYQAVIGLEVHIQLATSSKMFSPEGFQFGESPNTHLSAVTIAHPGALPTINQDIIRHAVKLGLATNCGINQENYFARKNYFYPDLPKGYQLTQDHTPICKDGYLDISLGEEDTKRIRIQRIHIEEDAGKSIHDQDDHFSLIDLNRAGVGLVELVTHPDLSGPDEASTFMSEIRRIIRFLGISDGNMEEGSLRCDANVSVKLKEAEKLGTRAEIKNINSFTQVNKAVTYEISRQIALIESGGTVVQETRTWNTNIQKTQSMRRKEEADDYRYFPEPDLLPLKISDEELVSIQASLPILPQALGKVYTEELGLAHHEVSTLLEDKGLCDYFEEMRQNGKEVKAYANWLLGSVKAWMNEAQLPVTDFPLSPAKLVSLVGLVQSGKLSHNLAKKSVFPEMVKTPKASAEEVATKLGAFDDKGGDELASTVASLIEEFPKEVEKFKRGKKGVSGFFVGQLMKKTKGKANPKEANKLVMEALQKAVKSS
ncbi:MAG: Asp-tRNA(Asn)/Glu-tRNA(Gln) amidotransferase subunit GatB [Bacteroidota bacterium]